MTQYDISLDGLSVMIGIPGGDRPPWETVCSLTGTLLKCQRMGLVAQPGIIKGCSIITKARDEVVHEFLQSDCNRLFWIDSDMEWEPEQFLRLLAFTQKVDVVGAAYPAKKDICQFYVNLGEPPHEISEYGLLEVHGLGLGFTAMRREVVERIVAGKPVARDQLSGRSIAQVFRTDIHQGNFRGEDMAFFADIRAAGYKVWLDPTIDLPHHGEKRYTGRFLDAVRIEEPACV